MTEQRFRMYGQQSSIVLSAALAALFALRALLAAQRVASLPGPVWAVINAVLAVLFTVRCFDRVEISSRGIAVYRVGIPHRLAADRIHRLDVVQKNAKWTRLYAVAVDGKRLWMVSERLTPPGQLRMRSLWDHTHAVLATRFQPLTAQAARAKAEAAEADAARQPAEPAAARRCVRSGCPEYFAEVRDPVCASCGSSTQRITT